MKPQITAQEILRAQERIRPFIYHTSFELSPLLSYEIGCSVFLKMENQQVSGSFKARGAYNKILAVLERGIRDRLFFTAASTGNHGIAFCTVINQLNLQGKVFLPKNVSPSKLKTVQALGVPFELFGRNSLETEMYCRRISLEQGWEMVHPYDDPAIIAGQGTVAKEMLEDVPDLDRMIVPVGGGGLIAGMASYVRECHVGLRIIGCQPVNSPEMVESIQRGEIVEEDISLPTLSDATAGGMEQGCQTFDICRSRVDEWDLITEEEIAFEIRYLLETHHCLIEGAAALPLASLRNNRESYSGLKVGVVLTGKRISLEKLKSILL